MGVNKGWGCPQFKAYDMDYLAFLPNAEIRMQLYGKIVFLGREGNSMWVGTCWVLRIITSAFRLFHSHYGIMKCYDSFSKHGNRGTNLMGTRTRGNAGKLRNVGFMGEKRKL